MKIDKILYINLDRCTDRNNNMINLLNEHKLLNNSIRINAVDGKQLNKKDILLNDVSINGINDAYNFEQKVYIPLTVGGIGCALSHKKCYQYIVDNKIPYCLILEDDIHVDNDLIDKLEQLNPPNDFEILFLGYHSIHIKKHDIVIKNNDYEYVKPIKAYGLFGYIVSYTGAKKLLDNVFPITQQIDSEIPKHFDKINVYAIKNTFIYSDPSSIYTKFGTDIQIRDKHNINDKQMNILIINNDDYLFYLISCSSCLLIFFIIIILLCALSK